MRRQKIYSESFILTVISVLFVIGCVPLSMPEMESQEIRDLFCEKLTCEECKLFEDIIYADDISVEGSLHWLNNKLKGGLELYESSIISSEIFILFEYPPLDFPSSYEEGVTLSSLGYLIQSDAVKSVGKSVIISVRLKGYGCTPKYPEYPDWFSVGRLTKETNKTKTAQVRFITTWLQQRVKPPKKKIHEVIEMFEWKNENWQLVNFSDIIFEEIGSSKTK